MNKAQKTKYKLIIRLVILILTIILGNNTLSAQDNAYMTIHKYGQLITDLDNPDPLVIPSIRYESNMIGDCAGGLKVNMILAWGKGHLLPIEFPDINEYNELWDEGNDEILIVLLSSIDYIVLGGSTGLNNAVQATLARNDFYPNTYGKNVCHCRAYSVMETIRQFYVDNGTTQMTCFSPYDYSDRCSTNPPEDNTPPPATNNNIGVEIPACVDTLKNEIKSLTGLNILVDLKYSILIDEDVDIDNDEAVKLKVKNDFEVDEFIYIAVIAPKGDSGWTSKFILSDGYESVLTSNQINQLTTGLNNVLASTPTNDMGNVICDALLSLKNTITEPEDPDNPNQPPNTPPPFDGTTVTNDTITCGTISEVGTLVDTDGDITISFPLVQGATNYTVSYRQTGIPGSPTIISGTEVSGKYIVPISGLNRDKSYDYTIEVTCGEDIIVHTGVTGNFQGDPQVACEEQYVQIGKPNNTGVGYSFFWIREDGNSLNTNASNLTKPRFAFPASSSGIFRVIRTHPDNITTDTARVDVNLLDDCTFRLKVSDKTLTISGSSNRSVETLTTTNTPTLHLVKDQTTGDGGTLRIIGHPLSTNGYGTGFPKWKEDGSDMEKDEETIVDYRITPKGIGEYEIAATALEETKKLKVKVHNRDETEQTVHGVHAADNVDCPPGSGNTYPSNNIVQGISGLCQMIEDINEVVAVIGMEFEYTCNVRQVIKCFRIENRNDPNVSWNQTRDIFITINLPSQDIPMPPLPPPAGAIAEFNGSIGGQGEFNFFQNQNEHISGRGPSITLSSTSPSSFSIPGELCFQADDPIPFVNLITVAGCLQVTIRIEVRQDPNNPGCYQGRPRLDPILVVGKVSSDLGLDEESEPYTLHPGWIGNWFNINCR